MKSVDNVNSSRIYYINVKNNNNNMALMAFAYVVLLYTKLPLS